MLDVGFHPMVWYPLQTMEKGGVRQVFLVAAGDASAATFSAWASESWKGTCEIVVVAAPEDADTADALRAVAPRLHGPTVVVAAGDLVTDVRLDDVLAAHVRRGAVATALLARRRAWNPVDVKTGRPPKGAHYIGLSDENHLLFMGDEEDVDKVLKIRRPTLRRAPAVTIRTDLVDAQLYALDVAVATALLEAKPHMRSLQLDVVPALVRRQFDVGSNAATSGLGFERQNLERSAAEEEDVFTRAVFGEGGEAAAGRARAPGGESFAAAARPCVAFVAAEEAYCARADTVAPGYLEISREVASSAPADAAHLAGRTPSKYDNFVEPSVSIGSKSTIGPGCIVGADVTLGEKCSVKRSVIGKGASVGTGVKLINAVVMPRATIEDGCTVQGCVVGPRAVIGAGTTLRECLVEAEYEVEEGEDVRGETLAQKAR